jgi:predicted MFS family arabinose efflux permease
MTISLTMSNTELSGAASSGPSATDNAAGGLAPVAVLALGTFAMGTDSFVLAGILPQLASGLAIPESAAGQVVTAFALTYGLAAPFIAAATARGPRKALLGLALALFALANLGSALAPDLPMLLATRIVAGAAQRGRALSIVLGGLTVGTVFGVPIGTALGQHLSSRCWRRCAGCPCRPPCRCGKGWHCSSRGASC